MELRKQIANWKNDLLAPNKSDVLANLTTEKNALLLDNKLDFEEKVSIDQDRLINKLYKQHRVSVKESGTPIFGANQNLIKFNFESNEYCSPISIASCSIKKNQYNKTYDIEQIEPYYINPFLVKVLGLNDEIMDQEELERVLDSKGLSFEIVEGQWLANFHPHRFILIKELERLENSDLLSSNINELLGDSKTETNSLRLSEGELFASDDDQIAVYSALEKENLVIQGPPGTGKSQVISNLVSKAIATDQSALLITEKKVALDVIKAKLKAFDLDHFCLLHHHELNPKDFIQSLKTTWEFLENRKKKNKPFSVHSKLSLNGLDLTLERLRQDNLIGGINYSTFKKHFKGLNTEKVPFVTIVPDIERWENDKKELQVLNDHNLSKSWTYVKTKKETNFTADLGINLRKIVDLIDAIDVKGITKKEIALMMRKSSVVSLFFYDDLLLPVEIFQEESKTQKKFLRIYHKFIRLKEECEKLEEEKEHWNKTFSLSELNDYISALTKPSLFNMKSKYFRKKLMKFTDLDLNDAKSTLENLVELKKKEDEFIKVKEQLRKMGVTPDFSELQYIEYTIRKTQQIDQNLINSLILNSKEELVKLKQLAENLSKLNSLSFQYLILDDTGEILPIVKTILSDLDQISANLKSIDSISTETKVIWRNTNSIDELESIIYKSHWINFEGRFPELANLDGQSLKKRIDDITNLKESEHFLFADHIKDKVQSIFEKYHALLKEPARKLSEQDKVLKKELRKGKSILVKAFGKTRSFPSIHDLLDSEAKYWIKLLHPIFLCSPYTVAKSLPFDQKFDLVIFDEASQIPLPHGLGGVQRSNRVVIAGDQQQMAPHFYFQNKGTTTHDLLHQASFHFQNVMLTNHYRSSNDSLIEYSNHNFYNDKLTTFPRPNAGEAIKLIEAGGKFIDRVNIKEAEVAANEIQAQLKDGVNDLGVVAFSKTQLEAILEQLPADIRGQLMDEDTGGFVQSLENVQGDQCLHLIISMGYAPNEEGDFHMRFGPLNQEQGHRRLNVLMSRAKEKITFIRSVRAKDFSISDNEGVEALRKLMLFLEDDALENQNIFPEQIKVTGKDNLEINAPHEFFKSANEMVSYCKVLKDRGWKIDLIL